MGVAGEVRILSGFISNLRQFPDKSVAFRSCGREGKKPFFISSKFNWRYMALYNGITGEAKIVFDSILFAVLFAQEVFLMLWINQREAKLCSVSGRKSWSEECNFDIE